jgi:hypothetical protein
VEFEAPRDRRASRPSGSVRSDRVHAVARRLIGNRGADGQPARPLSRATPAGIEVRPRAVATRPWTDVSPAMSGPLADLIGQTRWAAARTTSRTREPGHRQGRRRGARRRARANGLSTPSRGGAHRPPHFRHRTELAAARPGWSADSCSLGCCRRLPRANIGATSLSVGKSVRSSRSVPQLTAITAVRSACPAQESAELRAARLVLRWLMVVESVPRRTIDDLPSRAELFTGGQFGAVVRAWSCLASRTF